MSQGYPINFRPAGSVGGGARAAAIAVGRSPLSVAAVARTLSSIPRVPPPHPGILLGLGAAVAIGYAYKYFSKEGEQEEDVPYPAMPGGTVLVPGQSMPGDWTDHGTYYGVPGVTRQEGEFQYNQPDKNIRMRHSHREALHKNHHLAQRWWGEAVTYRANWGGMVDGFAYSGEFPAGWQGYGGGRSKVAAPPIPLTGIENVPGTVPDVEVVPINPPISLPRPRVGDRGISVTPAVTGSVVTPMTPAPEVKIQATRATMDLISATIGQVGETIDMTKCFMWATGNTYRGRDGTEKTIPQRQWSNALLYMAGKWHNKEIRLHGSKSMNNLTYSKWRNGSIVKADGSILTPQDVGVRLGQCLVKTYLSDLSAAKQSQFLSMVGGELGLTAGPLGLQSITNAIGGDVPYDGVFDLHF